MGSALNAAHFVAALEKPELFRNGATTKPRYATIPDTPARFHSTMQGYEETAVIECPKIAQVLRVSRVLVKDESRRLGTKSFKILGASWATYKVLAERVGVYDEARPSIERLCDALRLHPPLRLAAATDGNHGLAVARMANSLGIRSKIFVPANMAPARHAALVSEGAEVEIVPGNYDCAVEAVAALDWADCIVVSDTAWPGYVSIPGAIVHGYSTLGHELSRQLDQYDTSAGVVVAIQIGVGSFASSVIPSLQHLRPTFIGVEPTRAACALLSVRGGRQVGVDGPLDSMMAGLNCGRLSTLAWPVIRSSIDTFLAVDDEQAGIAMRLFAEEGIIAGESGAAGLAGLIAFRDELDLNPFETVVVINTEGATDPENYASVLGAKRGEIPLDS